MKTNPILVPPEIKLLRDAIRDNDAERVRAAIAAGARPAEAGFKKNGANALMMAMGLGSLDCARVLAPFFDWEETDENGFTALMWAAQSNQAACVLFALDNKANPDKKSRAGETALMLAVKLRCASCVAALAPVSNLKIKTPQGHTILRHAVDVCDRQMINAILSAPKPPLGMKSDNGETVLMHMISDGDPHPGLFEIMWAFHKQELLPVRKTGPLSWALRHGNEIAAKLILAQIPERLADEDLAESFVHSLRAERADWLADLAALSPKGLRAETESLAALQEQELNCSSKGLVSSKLSMKLKPVAQKKKIRPRGHCHCRCRRKMTCEIDGWDWRARSASKTP